jgi:putative membrane protein
VIQRADLAFGISAGVLLVVGFCRVLYFEQGPSYYFHSVPFAAKLALFLIVGLLSIIPTREFMSWRKSMRQGQVPIVTDRKMRTIRSILHWEILGVVMIVLCAALMAKGVGSLP